MRKSKVVAFTVAVLLTSMASFAAESAPPNIVFLMTDDQRWDTLGCYGRSDVKTPHIDRLAEQGVAFDKAYYAVAICMPSRTTMFTGRYVSDHQVGFTYPYNRTLPKEEFADSYPARLKEAGYRTGFVGKFGIRLENTPQTAAEHFDFFVHGGTRWPKGDAGLKHIFRRDRPREERTLMKGDVMIRFLETQPTGQPFCLSISFDAVKNDRDHDMYTPHVEVFKDKQMWVPENWVQGKNERLPKLLDHWRGTSLHVARTSTPELYQTVVRRFATQGYTVDQQVGRLMAKLEEMGVLDNTIVIYTSDNGRFHGSHGLYDKALLYEESMKAPLVVFDGRAPQKQRGRREGALISSADVAPTILSLAGIEAPKSMKGHDFSGVLDGTQDMSEWRDTVLLESLFIQELHSANVNKHPDIPGLNDEIIAKNRSYRCRGVRTERWKYFVYYEHTPVIEELYDLESDPHEQNNLISHPEYSDILSKLRAKTHELHADAAMQASGLGAAPLRPNVVFIFADDLGYGDVGCYGATKVQTPNIDRLAEEGRRFTDAHSASAVCTPSRYALLTGDYPVRANGGKGVWGPAPITSGLLIDTDTLTIADVFKNQGYATAALGKWHLGLKEGKNDWQEPLRPGPQDLGFDYYFGLPVVNSAPPYVYVENDRIVGGDPADPLVYLGRGWQKEATPITKIPPEAAQRSPNAFKGAVEAHKTYNDYTVGTVLAEKAVDWITANKQKPFFLYLATTHIHHPFTPGDRFQGSSEAALYGDFIQELDWMVGEVTRCLEEQGLSENTLVLFTSDNGGMFNLGGQTAFRQGHRINGDLLGFKFGAWEGGHRVPFIATWPGKIDAGTQSDQLICHVDMLASFMALTGQDPDVLQDKDSVNILPALLEDPEESIRKDLLLAPKSGQHLSIRKGKWMYIPRQGSGGFTGKTPGHHGFAGPPAAAFVGSVNSDIEHGKIKQSAPPAQLYDLEADVNQTKNVYNDYPEVARELEAMLASYRPRGVKNRKKRQRDRAHKSTKGSRPNVVVIFADDLGYGDLSCYGPTGVETPHLDALAMEGFRSTDFFVPANVCSPSRAALLTGRYPMRCGFPVARHEGEAKYNAYGLAPYELTIPELLKTAGYRSLMVGKWHLGMQVEGSHPLDAGFDEYLGISSNYSPARGPDYNTLYRGKEVEERNVAYEALTKRYTDEVVSFIERHSKDPFFIYVSHHIVHNPLKPSRAFVGASTKGRYGDFVKELDHSTGRIMKAIRDAGIDDDTIVVFTSDNGPTIRGSAGGLGGGKYCTMEGGHRVPGIFRWPGQIPAGQVSDITMTSMDLLPLFCELAGVEQPGDRTIDGKPILPILQGEAAGTPHKWLYYYNGVNLQAVREGDWKLHLPRTARDQPFWSKKPSKKKGFVTLAEPALFNLELDPGEKRNVVAEHPDVVARLLERAETVRSELGDVRTTGTDQRAIKLTDPQER